MHVAGKSYRAKTKTLNIHKSTVRQIAYKWRLYGTVATLHRNGRLSQDLSKGTPQNDQ